jgi:hypothetical protein
MPGFGAETQSIRNAGLNRKDAGRQRRMTRAMFLAPLRLCGESFSAECSRIGPLWNLLAFVDQMWQNFC